MSGLGEECNSSQVDGSREYIALPGNQRPSESGIEKVFLSQLPGYEFTHRRTGLATGTCQRIRMLPWNGRFRRSAAHGQSRHDFAAILRLIGGSLGIETCHEAILHFMRIR